MTNNEKLVEVLNDLVKINNDRIEGYEKAVAETDVTDTDLQVIFRKMEDESWMYKEELRAKIYSLGGEIATDTTIAGKIYRAWMTLKDAFSASDRKSVLDSCEFGEDAAQKAYNEALESDAEIEADTRQLIMKQKNSLKESHDMIKKYRDMHHA